MTTTANVVRQNFYQHKAESTEADLCDEGMKAMTQCRCMDKKKPQSRCLIYPCGLEEDLAATYSPTRNTMQYHRRKGA